MNGNEQKIKEFIAENWDKIKETVRNEYELSSVSYSTFIKPLVFHDVDEKNNKITILIPSNQTQFLKFINTRYTLCFKVTIGELISDLTDSTYEISFILENDVYSQDKTPESNNAGHSANYENAFLNNKYTFDSFVVGNNNDFAHSAALAVAESPGTTYNPLYIYGGAGLGKTHLMHAIGHFILSSNPEMKVLCVTSEQYYIEVIDSIRSGDAGETTKLREKYRTIDVLLLDDVQFLFGKKQSQLEFFHTFNVLRESGKQIVLTSDKPPKDLDLEDRFKSRFAQGLTTSISPPEYETRMAILQKYAETLFNKIDINIIEYIAKNVTSNVRELEGALKKVHAYAKLVKGDLKLDDIEDKLNDIIYSEKQKITPNLIINVVSEQFDVSIDDIKSKRRDANIAIPRQIVMYLCREMTDFSYDHIGTILNRDHTTVIHGA
ncbi:MAG: chromosomal replication initiator protein DnaA, partial [Lachnospiraceae bacterium]|nr:chromosomal replication initiator protein DnaA [Lachnospiraceae bacterium]